MCIDHPDDPPAVVTTNYDTMLEDAIREEARKRGVATSILDRRSDSSEVKPGRVGVRHLHGVLTPGNQLIGKLVMSDSDYYSMQDAGAWQELFFERILRDSTCLFVGTSLTDPNLLRYVYRTESERRHFAVFTRQAESELYDSDQASVMTLREESQFAKWRAVGIEPILLDHYSESAQFIWELLAARRLGDQYAALPNRLESWWQDMEIILPTGSQGFVAVQERLQRIMAKALASTKSLINSEGFRVRPGERLGISMWVYNPVKEALVNWASADRLWRDPVTLEPTKIHWSSSFVAALAFCAGSMVSQSTSQHVVSRWNHVIGFPIFAHTAAGRLPVGVVTLASTEDKDASILHRAEDVVRGSAIPQLEMEIETLLAPVRDPIGLEAESNSVTPNE
jgi:hypothetical protein